MASNIGKNKKSPGKAKIEADSQPTKLPLRPKKQMEEDDDDLEMVMKQRLRLQKRRRIFFQKESGR